MSEPAAPEPQWPPPPPAEALACPRCKARADPGPGVQTCSGCGKPFALYAGPLLDRSVVPPKPGPETEVIRVKSADAFVRRFGCIDAACVQEGALDPVTGRFGMGVTKIVYTSVFTVAIWRKLPVGSLIAFFAFLVPGLLLIAAGSIAAGEPIVFLIFGLPWLLLCAWVGYQIFVVKAHWARVVGPKARLLVRFDRPGRRRQKFHDELLRRCGVAPGPIP